MKNQEYIIYDTSHRVISICCVQLGELGEELARDKPAQSKVEMLEAQVQIMQERLSKVWEHQHHTYTCNEFTSLTCNF